MINGFIKIQKMQWLGHTKQLSEDAAIRQLVNFFVLFPQTFLLFKNATITLSHGNVLILRNTQRVVQLIAP